MASSDLKTFFIHGKGSKPAGSCGGYCWWRTGKGKYWYEILDETTRNQAEYLALVSVLRYVVPKSRVLILTDSQLVVDQFAGKCRVVNPELRKAARQVNRLIEEKELDVDVQRAPDGEPNDAAQLLSQQLQFDRLGLLR
jgi:ribonuclease HI